jgi:hypothetical protein
MQLTCPIKGVPFLHPLCQKLFVKKNDTNGQPVVQHKVNFMFERGVARAQHANPQAIPIISMKINDETMLIGTEVLDNITQPDALKVTILMYPFYSLATQTYHHSLADNINKHTRVWNWGIATPLLKGCKKNGFRKTLKFIATYERKSCGNTTHTICLLHVKYYVHYCPCPEERSLGKSTKPHICKDKRRCKYWGSPKVIQHTFYYTTRNKEND